MLVHRDAFTTLPSTHDRLSFKVAQRAEKEVAKQDPFFRIFAEQAEESKDDLQLS